MGEKDPSSEIHLPDQKKETNLRTIEYWAEVTGDYFSDPSYLKENFPEDYKMVDDEVKKIDPSFDPIVAQMQRDAIIKEMVSRSKGH